MLKIDLEGWEFDALTTFLLPDGEEYSAEKPRVPRVSQMLLELHLWGRDFPDLLNWWSVLERAGLRAVAREPNLVYQNYNRMQGAELAEVCCRKLLLLRNDKLTLRIFSIRSLISQRRTYSFRKMAHRRYLRPGLPYRTLKILQMSPRLWHPFTRTICTSADDGREKSILFLSRLHVYIWSVCIWRISFLFMLWFTTGPMLFFRLHARTYLP